MEFAYSERLEKRKKADALVLPFWKNREGVQLAAADVKGDWQKGLAIALETKDFSGKEGETLVLYQEGMPEKRVILLGLGSPDQVTVESLRRAYGTLTKGCLAKKIRRLNIVLPEQMPLESAEMNRGIVEGLLLPNYAFKRYQHQEFKEDEEGELLQQVTWIGHQPDILAMAEKIAIICDGVDYARDLVNANADEVTPQYLSHCAQGLSKEQASIKTTVFDKKRIEKEGLHLLLAVNRGAAVDPAFIIMEYRGNPQSNDHVIVVGKGITYDTGGLNLKPTGGMETMKCDMAGAAACFGVMVAVSQLKLKINLTVIVPSTENGIDAKSFKPGDVYQSYLGKTVEMTNSDAEGRLILADGLAYACKNLKPTHLIDIATLTGAIEVALGSEASGLMSTDEAFAQALLQAGDNTFERLWRMPLYEEYKEKLKSDIADLKSWNGRSASSSVAATFLRHFVPDNIPWAHLDIAGTAYVTEAKKYLPKYATGFGVRLIVDFLEQLEQKQARTSALHPKKRSKKSQK